MDLLAWYNLIFVAPVALAAVYLALSATGIGDLSGEIDADADVDFDHDLDLDMDHDVEIDLDADADVDLEMDHDLDADFDHDAEIAVEGDLDHDVHGGPDLGAEHEVHELAEAHEASLLLRALSVLGFGKVPVSILMTCLMVIFGATGLMANGLFETVAPWSWAPSVYFWPSLGLATIASLGLTGTVARTLSRLMPTRESYAVTEEELVGQVGVSVYGISDGGRGPINVKDTGGTLHQVRGRTIDGAIPKGHEVLLVRYHREEDCYDVATSPLSAIAGSAQASVTHSTTASDRSARGASAKDVEARSDDERTSSTRS
ncbi:MAG: hypothetical protein ACOX9R_00525 [Armatimonadota bacterium]|jgi:membrane protein implicated in regulation of membrane protease activity